MNVSRMPGDIADHREPGEEDPGLECVTHWPEVAATLRGHEDSA
jgi:hypothetical protein